MWKILIVLCMALASGTMQFNTPRKLGEKCKDDDYCEVDYSFCGAQQTCECKRGFEPRLPTKDRCIANIGAVCSSTHDCIGLVNAECNQEACSCRNGFVAHPSMKECLQVTSGLKGSCVEHAQCTTVLGDRAECRNNKCQCMPKHHYANKVCILSKRLNETCSDTAECHVSDTDEEKNRQVQCTAGRCQCVICFKMANDPLTCIKDGASSIASISILAALIITCLVNMIK